MLTDDNIVHCVRRHPFTLRMYPKGFKNKTEKAERQVLRAVSDA